MQLSCKTRATGVRILLFGLRYFGGEIRILSPHLQLTASGPSIWTRISFLYQINDFITPYSQNMSLGYRRLNFTDTLAKDFDVSLIIDVQNDKNQMIKK